jgi:predicted transcriptional regulator
MKTIELIEKLELHYANPSLKADKCVNGVYASDLLSDVMGFAKPGEVWVTLQTHKNVAAIAGLKDLSGVIIVGGHKPDDDMLEKCTEEEIPVFTTNMSTYMVCGKIYEILNK